MCDNCLKILMENLTRDEMKILNLLLKRKCFNSQLTLDKTSIIPSVEGLTDFKFNTAMGRLELIGVIKRVTSGRLHNFYITETGRSLIKIYEEEVRSTFSQK